MKKLKVSEVLKMLSDDGWYLSDQKGSHRQFKNLTKKGKVTVNGKPSETLEQFILNNIFKTSGLAIALILLNFRIWEKLKYK